MTRWIALLLVSGMGLHASRPTRPARPTYDEASLRVQVALDRAGFSVGQIDGQPGGKTEKALMAFQHAHGLSGSDASIPDTPATITYQITAEDVSGPFTERIPKDLAEQGSLDRLGYTSPLELLSERFHASPKLLQQLNPGVAFTAGATITVPNVEPLVPPEGSGKRKGPPPAAVPAAQVLVSKEHNDVVAVDSNGAVLFYAPVSSGSGHDPLPLGEWTVRGVYLNPTFNYNPDLFWDAAPSHTKTKIPPGPNNPVGFVWIDLDREHYGLHGTPEPANVGITQSHGCVRLTNWDAIRLASLVQDGTPVIFRQ